MKLKPLKTLSATVHLGILTEGWNLTSPFVEGGGDIRVFRFQVYFGEPFDVSPVVHLGLAGFDIDQRDSGRLILNTTEITPAGFIAEISTWHETRVYAVAFSWLALGT